MLQPYIRNHVSFLDTASYIVQLRDAVASDANRKFVESGDSEYEWIGSYWDALFRAKFSRFGVSPLREWSVLDICCGQGHLGSFVAREYGSRVTYGDLSANQIRRLREKLNFSGEGGQIVVADVLDLPFESGHYDLVVGNSFLHHVSDVPRAFSEFRRVLKANGLLVLFHEPTETAPLWESFPISLYKDTNLVSGNFTDLWMFTASDLRRLAFSAGFTDVRLYSSGMLSAVLINWLLIVSRKYRQSGLGRICYQLRVWIEAVDLSLQGPWKERCSPSIMLVARRSNGNNT